MLDIVQLLHENYWRFFKGNILQTQRKIRTLPLDEIKKIQWKRLKKLLDYVYGNNEFYKNYFESVNLTPDDIKEPQDMLKLPITEKKTYQKNFNKIISKGANEDALGLSQTSGSTGEPLKFYVDKINESPTIYAAFILNKEAMGIKPFKKINELEIKTIPHAQTLDVTKEVKIKKGFSLKNLFSSNNIGISTLDIKHENYYNIIKIIKANKIETIYGYTSSILTLAQHLIENDIKIKMNYIYSIGEELLEHNRTIISTAFSCPVYVDYGAAECMRMGFECKYQHGFHMDIYNYFFEYIKENNYAKDGEIADVVVTNLNNYVFPFIRYRLGDRVVVSNRSCQCNINFPIVEKVTGRITDPFLTPSGKELKLIFFEEFELLYDFVSQYQVIQIKKDELLVKIVPTNKMTEQKRIELEKKIHELTERSMKVNIKLVKEIPTLKSGKKRAIISKKEYEKLIKNGEIL